MLVLAIAGGMAYFVVRQKSATPPEEVADDPLLVAGRRVYLARCISCHGEAGRGDGPIARTLAGPPPGDLTDDRWNHGGRPEDVLAVVAKGVPGTAMSGWSSYLDEEDVRAVTGYVLHLAGRPVPAPLRR